MGIFFALEEYFSTSTVEQTIVRRKLNQFYKDNLERIMPESFKPSVTRFTVSSLRGYKHVLKLIEHALKYKFQALKYKFQTLKYIFQTLKYMFQALKQKNGGTNTDNHNIFVTLQIEIIQVSQVMKILRRNGLSGRLCGLTKLE